MINATILERPILGGTDGFRDKATDRPGSGLMNEETLAGLTDALVDLRIEQGYGNLCVTGRDTRPSGEKLERAVCAGAVAAGGHVLRLGVAPTPAVLKVAQVLEAGSAVAVTASHNPPKYNGWKGTLGENKPSDTENAAISRRYWTGVDGSAGRTIDLETADGVPEVPGMVELYKTLVVQSIEAEFDQRRPLEGKIFVVDGANGAAMKVTPAVLRELGATVHEFACDGSGPINQGCGAADLDGMKQYLKDHPEIVSDPNFVGALANDGDGDRMIGLGAKVLTDGNVEVSEMEGNRVMELLAEGEPGIVGTTYTNDAMVKRLRERGIGFEFCDNGDTNVTAALRAKQAQGQNWRRGGEFTGHHIDTDWLSSGDGVRMAAWLAAYAATHGKSFAELADSMPLWHEKMAKVNLGRNNTDEMGRADVGDVIERAKARIANLGRFVVRASGTERGIYRVWGVGEDQGLVDDLVTEIADTMRFPTTFAENVSLLAPEDLDEDGQDALSLLREAGYEVVTGLRREDVPAVTAIAGQDGVREFCPKDLSKRFGDEEMAEEWQTKGRFFFQLRRVGQAELAGYGWTGPEPCAELPDCENTFAIRVNEADGGKGLGALFTRAIISGSKLRMGKIGLETWASNVAAVKSYERAGAIVVERKPDTRPTINGPAGSTVQDTRLFMYFPQTF
jgi:phosphoglucosamine mutase